jgi:hypothetical protein
MARSKAKTDDGKEALARNDRLQSLVGRHQAEADRRVSLRQPVEEEWHLDLLQFHSRYDDDTIKNIKEVGGCQLFVPVTRPRTNAMSARIMDILFPTDDKNWAIEPTPVPMMGHNGGPAMQPGIAPVAMPGAAPAAPPEDINPAATACELMSKEIDDQLTECDYAAQCRDMIDDACKIGTGVIEGPIVNDRARRGWAKAEDGSFGLQFHDDPRPAFYRVDPWGFFPDPLARVIRESETNYQRYLYNKTDLIKFAKRQGVDREAIKLIIAAEPDSRTPVYLTRLRALTGETVDTTQKFYHLWKVSGPLSAEDMRDLAMAFGDEKTAAEMDDADPLEEVRAVLWFCQGHALKFDIYPLDSGECNYSVFNLEKDEASIWGYGDGRMIRDPQKGLNAAFRMVIDNGGLATGDQVIINKSVIQPEAGDDWKQRPRKTWEFTETAGRQNVDVRTAFYNFSTDSHVEELSAIMGLCYRMIDDASGVPSMNDAQDPGTIPANTPVGTAILRTAAANVVFKRIIKAWDDDVTVPNLRRLYDWNMQFSPKEEIKGDFDVKARGASTLLVREMQNQNLLMLANTLGAPGSPYAKYLKGVKIARELVSSLSLDPDELIASDEEAAAADEAEAQAMQAQAAGPAGADPEVEKRKLDLMEEETQAKVAISDRDADAREKVAELAHETAMMNLAQQGNMKLDQIEAMLANSREERASKESIKRDEMAQKERSIAAEIAVKAQPKEPLNKTQIANS